MEGKNEISWRAAEYDHVEKGLYWYLAVGGVSLLLLAFALWQKNFFFGIFIVIAGIMLIALGNRRPDVLDFKLTEKGFDDGRGSFYEYEQLDHFSVRNRLGRLDELMLKKKSAFNPFLRIPIDSKTAGEARIFLAQKLTEVEYEPTILDALVDLFGL